MNECTMWKTTFRPVLATVCNGDDDDVKLLSK